MKVSTLMTSCEQFKPWLYGIFKAGLTTIFQEVIAQSQMNNVSKLWSIMDSTQPEPSLTILEMKSRCNDCRSLLRDSLLSKSRQNLIMRNNSLKLKNKSLKRKVQELLLEQLVKRYLLKKK